MKLRIATRKSALALWQTNHVIEQLQQAHADLSCESVEIVTQGDKNLSSSLAKIGGKGLFLKELEQALLSGEADIAVHSLKDVPAEPTPGLRLIAFLKREAPFDVLLMRDEHTLASLPKGSVIGTSSLRRQSQLKALRADLQFKLLRGNVPTRIAKLDAGEFDAIVLAQAGVKRLQYAARISEILTPAQCLPAVGQGVIVIQARSDDKIFHDLCAVLNHADTHDCVLAERALHALLGGSCQTPLAALATLAGDTVDLQAMVAMPDGTQSLRGSHRAPRTQAVQLGEALGEQLLAQGAKAILDSCRGD